MSKEYVGEFPIRQDVTVIPADDSEKLRIGWVIEEFMGSEIFKPFDDWIEEFKSALEEKGYYGHLLSKHAIKSLNGISVGDVVIIPSLFGLVEAEVTEVNYEAKGAKADGGGSWYPLDFAQDNREAWVSSAQISKAIRSLRL